MRRINEKVKDLVEVRAYKSLLDFTSDPMATLAAYHFTDFTSDLMSKWLDRLVDVGPENGNALALAGYRGVGKSHFLATLGAIVSQPELRSRLADPHVSASTQRLKRRRYPVAFVRRGTNSTLFAELKDAIAKLFSLDVSILTDSLPQVLHVAAERAGEMPLVLVIDTAFERAARVSRDDGVLLSEIAEIAKNLNIFVGVALDDDISGADGVNSAIARTFSIDYLDQEHLYRIVDTHVFPKNQQMRPLLHEIYNYFRTVLPNFRWSEQRFSALYPLHPILLENAPFVRLYAPEFALLGFASEAGNKILGRPANSLIALDEVFDCAEANLRRVPDLQEAFAAYDRLNTEVIGKISVMQRLTAKLILKGLLLLSLDGDGTTSKEISAAMLIFDENDPELGVKMVEDVIETFVSVLPDQIWRKEEEGREVRYSLKVSVKESLNNSLSEAAQKVSTDVVPKMLRKLARENFSDWTFTEEAEAKAVDWSDSQITWRGGLRRGRLCWNLDGLGIDAAQMPSNQELFDWIVIICPEHRLPAVEAGSEIPKVFWQHAPLRNDEIEAIQRYFVLLNDETLRDEFGEQIRAAGHAHKLTVEKIWHRVFLQDGKLTIEGLDYNFNEEARHASSLAGVLKTMLEPLFEQQFPDHPVFSQPLGMTEVASLVNDLFSGSRQNLPEVQRLAEIYAHPLGLVTRRGNYFVLETEENLLQLPLAQEVLALVRQAGDETISLRSVYRYLKRAPIGLVREAQHLLLTALVANRQIEFVTTKGDRINRRSLDLKIIWDDIEGIAKPSAKIYPAERLTEWARILTGIESVASIDLPEDRETIVAGLESWLDKWETARLLERFNALPDEILNTKIWRLSTLAEKTFGSVATTLVSLADGSITLDESLHRVADAFSDSREEFAARERDLVVLEDFISGTRLREEIRSFLAVCEPTDDEKIEQTRDKLLAIVEDALLNPNQLTNREMENLWQAFHARFTEYFAHRHDVVMLSHHLPERFEEIRSSDAWWEFENLSQLPIFPRAFWKESQQICRRFQELDCRYNVREMLKTHPFCVCSFTLTDFEEWERLPETLLRTIERGRTSYRKILLALKDTMAQLVSHFNHPQSGDEYAEAAANLVDIFKTGREIPPLTSAELIILQKSFENLPTSLFLQTNFPATGDFLSREELKEKLNRWLDELPDEPVLVRV